MGGLLGGGGKGYVAPPSNYLGGTGPHPLPTPMVLMMGRNKGFKGVLWKTISKLSFLRLHIWSTTQRPFFKKTLFAINSKDSIDSE